MNQNRKPYIAGALAVLVFLFLLFLLFGGRRSNQPTYLEQLHLPAPFSAAQGTEENTAIFSNGRSFVQYNYRSGETESLSAATNMPTVNNIQLSNNNRYIIFRSSGHSFNSPYGTILNKEDLPLASAYWWGYDRTSGKLYILGDGGNLIVTSSSSDVYYRAVNGDDTGFLEIKSVANIPIAETGEYVQGPSDLAEPIEISGGIRQFFPFEGGFLVENNQGNVIRVDEETGSRELITSDVRNLVASPSGRYATVNNLVTESDQTIDLKMLEVEKEKLHNLGEFDESFSVWLSDSDTVLYRVNNDRAITKSGIGGRAVNLVASEEELEDAFALLVISNVVGPDTYTGSAEFKDFYILSEQELFDIPSPEDYSVRLVSNTIIEYSQEYNRFVASIVGEATVQKRQAVYSRLSQDGFNPDLYQIEFVGTSYQL